MAGRAKEPNTAPQPEHWYPLTLGRSLKDDGSGTRFHSLRYEFKPASIDTSRPGTLHKGVENKVTVEFYNNQAGKQKVAFQGNSEDYKDLDGVIFFDGKSFRLERLHRAFKSLRHVRQPGESAVGAGPSAGNSASASGSAADHASPVHGTDGHHNRALQRPVLGQHIEEIIVGQVETQGKKNLKRGSDTRGHTPLTPPTNQKQDQDESPIHIDIDIDGDEASAKDDDIEHIDINIDEVADEHEADYEIEDVVGSEDENAQKNKSENDAAALLRAQNNPKHQSSSDSGSSDSGSGSGSGSDDSSSDSDGTGDESGSSAEDA